MGGNNTYNSVMQVLLDTLDQMYYICLAVAFIIVLLSVYRNYQQFGEMLGMKYAAVLLLSIFLIVIFPATSEMLFKAMLDWGSATSQQMENAVSVLMAVEIEGSWLEAIPAALANFFYKGSIYVGNFFRDIMILLCTGLFLVLKTLSPIFIAMITVPEMKSVGTNFLMLVFGFIMLPLCMIFGDLTCIWVLVQVWEHTGMAAAISGTVMGVGGVGAATALTSLMAAPPVLLVVGIGFAGAMVGFAAVWVMLSLIMYIGVPWAILSLFRGSGIGNALAMTMQTGSSVKAATISTSGAGKGAVGSITGIASKIKAGLMRDKEN